MAKTNSGLVAYAKAQVGKPYWYGTYGQTATAALLASQKKQYPAYYTASDFESQIGQRVHDCSGLIKGYLWSDSATSTPTYKASQDKSAKLMYSAASSKGAIGSFPKKAGQLVFRGASTSAITHVGVYGGDGYVYEAKGHSYGVVKTAYKASDWNYWAQHPDITDDTSATSSGSTTSSSSSSGSSSSLPSYTVGKTYTLQVDRLTVRTGAGTSYSAVSYSGLTSNAKANAYSNGTLKKGTKVTCKATKTVGSDVWMQIPSGWIAAYYNGKNYVK